MNQTYQTTIPLDKSTHNKVLPYENLRQGDQKRVQFGISDSNAKETEAYSISKEIISDPTLKNEEPLAHVIAIKTSNVLIYQKAFCHAFTTICHSLSYCACKPCRNKSH